ncbi:MAG: TIGR00270 family protein [DPANN group archaeon]|nr:TIGR00270 family protein [DPANN group archaeon]
MHCDMCGTESELFKCEIEETYLNVCKKCSKHGEVIQKIEHLEPEIEEISQKPIERSEVIQIITQNYPKLIKNKREQIGLKQKELAKKIAEKESVIHKLESGHMEPDIQLARKLEKFLNIKLVEQYKEKGEATTVEKSEGFTIGDLVNIKK